MSRMFVNERDEYFRVCEQYPTQGYVRSFEEIKEAAKAMRDGTLYAKEYGYTTRFEQWNEQDQLAEGKR